MLNVRFGGRIIGHFLPTREAVGSVRRFGKCLRRLNWRTFISRRSKRWSTRSSLKEIVNFVFNKSTQETRRTRLPRLILQKKTLRKTKQPLKMGLKKLWHKIPKKGILLSTRVKLTIGGWQHCFVQVSRYIFYNLTSFFGGSMILSLLECLLRNIDILLFQVAKVSISIRLFYLLYFYTFLSHFAKPDSYYLINS